MGGLLLRAFAGGMAGLGDSMIAKAKQQREDALNALARSQKVEDQQAQFAHEDKSQGVTEAGADRRLATSEAGANTRTNIAEAGATKRTGITEAGADRRNAATISSEDTRQQAGFTHDDNTVDKVLPPQPDGSSSAMTKSGKVIPLNNPDGSPVMGDVSLTPAETRLLAVYKQQNVVRDANGQVVPDSYGHPQADWGSIDTKLRAAGKGNLADKISGVAPGGTGSYVVNPAGAPAGGRGLTTNLFGGLDKNVPEIGSVTPPQAAVDFLKKNPGTSADFDNKYGQGAASRALAQ